VRPPPSPSRARLAPAWGARFGLSAALCLLAAGCHIFGLTEVPCSNENAVQECLPEEVCFDGACHPRLEAEPACVAPAPASREVRAARIGVAARRGVEAMGTKLFGLEQDALLVFDCAPACSTLSDAVPRERAPLAGDVGAAGLANGRRDVVSGARVDTSAPYAFELVFRAPTQQGRIAATTGAGTTERNGWVVGTGLFDGRYRTGVDIGGNLALLAEASEGVWSYVLCVVDPARIAALDPAGFLCTADGLMAFEPEVVLGYTPAPASTRLTLGGAPNDGAVAFIRTWSGRPPDLPSEAGAAHAAVLEEARRRLLRYVGVEIEAAGAILASNSGSIPRVLELPAFGAAPPSLALVGGSWPRIAEVDGEEGILFEEGTTNLLGNLQPCRARVLGPTGKEDACALGEAMDIAVNLERGAPFTFSTLVQKSAHDVVVSFEGQGAGLARNEIQCDLTGVGDCRDAGGAVTPAAFRVDDLGAWERHVLGFANLSFRVERVRIAQRSADAAVWAPQLEDGLEASSPIPFFVATAKAFTTARVVDALILDGVGLGVTSELSLEARILRGDSAVAPVTVLSDEAADDGLLELTASFGGDGADLGAVVGRVEGVAVGGTAAGISAPPVTIVGHVGAPVVPCASCEQLGTVSAGRLQAELVVFAGKGAVVEHAAVSARGAPPAPTALGLRVATPPLVPCVDGAEPLFTFAVCARGPCESGAVKTRWDTAEDGAGLAASVVEGPFPGDLAAAGRFTADLHGEPFFGTLYAEVRFETPPAGERGPGGSGGDILQIVDADGPRARFFLEERDDGGFTLVVSAGGPERVVATLGPSEWNQVACLFDAPLRCSLNLGPVLTFGEIEAPRIAPLVSAAVGGGALVASAHGAFVERPRDPEAAAAVLSTRALESFGLLLEARRAAVIAEESRGEQAFISITQRDGSLALRRVGAHWPRVEDARGLLEYAVEPGGADPLVDEALLALGAAPGPHPTLRAGRVEGPVTLALPADALEGVVSVFVEGVEGGEKITLRAGTTSVSLPDGRVAGEAPAGIDDYGAWRRIWVRAARNQGAELVVEGSVLLSSPQRDPGTARPSPPAISAGDAGERQPRDALRLRTTDLSSRTATAFSFSIDERSLGGRFVELLSVVGSASESFALTANGGNLVVSVARREAAGGIPTPVTEAFGAVGPPRDFVYWWRDGVAAFLPSGGTAVLKPAPSPLAPATQLIVGGSGSRVRLRGLTVKRGDP
jgi:hypothetical protein